MDGARVVNRVLSVVERCSDWMGWIAAFLVAACVLLTGSVVLLRYGFSMPTIALQELAVHSHAAAFLLALGYALRHDQHVRVDLLYRAWPQRRRDWVDLLGTVFLLLPVCVLIGWLGFEYAATSLAQRESSREAGGLPALYLVKALMPLAALLLALQGIASAGRAAQRLFGSTSA